eukprot:jgi/Botrbrau1/10639/Bobra.154_1s0028.1
MGDSEDAEAVLPTSIPALSHDLAQVAEDGTEAGQPLLEHPTGRKSVSRSDSRVFGRSWSRYGGYGSSMPERGCDHHFAEGSRWCF